MIYTRSHAKLEAVNFYYYSLSLATISLQLVSETKASKPNILADRVRSFQGKV